MFTSNEKGEFFTESKGMRKIEEGALENYCHFLVAMDFFLFNMEVGWITSFINRYL